MLITIVPYKMIIIDIMRYGDSSLLHFQSKFYCKIKDALHPRIPPILKVLKKHDVRRWATAVWALWHQFREEGGGVWRVTWQPHTDILNGWEMSGIGRKLLLVTYQGDLEKSISNGQFKLRAYYQKCPVVATAYRSSSSQFGRGQRVQLNKTFKSKLTNFINLTKKK